MLNIFMINAIEIRRNRVGRVPITVFMSAKSKRESKYLCRVAPRYRDAILRQLSKNKYPLTNDGKLNLELIHDELVPVIKKVDRQNIVLGVEVRQGATKVPSSAVRMFNRIGCMQYGFRSKGKK